MHEIVHHIMRSALFEFADVELAFDGHIATYNGDTGKATVIVPVQGIDDSDEGETPAAYETGPIPVAVPFSGQKWGVQYIFKGGATVENPNDGEPVLVIVQNRENGYAYCIPGNYNQAKWIPPLATPDDNDASSDPDDSPTPDVADDSDAGQDESGTAKGQPGELIVKLETNTLVKFYEDGSVRFNGVNSVALKVKQNANINIEEGNVNLMVKTGDVNSTIMQGNLTSDVRVGNATMTVDQGNMSINVTNGTYSVAAKTISMTSTQNSTYHADGLMTQTEGIAPS